MYKTNKTGYTGVCFLQRDQKYRAAVRLNGKKFYLGCYSDVLDAAKKVSDFKEKNKNFFVSIQTSHCPNIDVPSLKLFFLLCAMDFYNSPISTTLKSYYLKSLQSLKNPIKNADKILDYYFSILDDFNSKVMKSWLDGVSLEKLGKKYNYSSSQIDRIVIRNLEPLYRKNLNNCFENIDIFQN